MMTKGTRIAMAALVAAVTLHCSGGRGRRPVVVPGPAPQPALNSKPADPNATPNNGQFPQTPVNPTPAPGPGPQPGDLGNNTSPQPGASPTSPGQAPGVAPGSSPAAPAPMTITTPTDAGEVSFQWDGKTFLGNDKWDVAPQ